MCYEKENMCDCMLNFNPWKYKALVLWINMKNSKGRYLTSPMCETVSLYKYTVRFYASLFDRVVTSSTYVVLSHKVPKKYVNILFLG